jgi:hypothetical protein
MAHPATNPNPARRQTQRILKIHKQLDELRSAVRWAAEANPTQRLYRECGVADCAEELCEGLTALLRPIGAKEFGEDDE